MHALQQLAVGLVRRTWLVAGVTMVVCAALAARAVAALVEASYLAPSLHGVSSTVPAKQPPNTRVTPDGTGFVTRNMFCSTCDAVHGEPGSTSSFEPEAALIATSIGAEPRATVRVLHSAAQGSFGIGDRVPSIGSIVRIGWTSIELVDARGRHGTLFLLGPSSLDPLAVSRGEAGAATPAPAAAAEPWAGRIKKIDDHTFEVERGLVRELVSGAVKPGGARIVPITGEQGALKGLQLFGVRDGSLPSALGLKNADLLSDVNGTHIESANTLLDLYARLDQLSVVQLEGTRHDKPFGIELRLR
ncbi:MAG: ral secretion pathway protein [Myxococcales bacterium]|nr:ral secretion pathway protein [Myxococcales bacterium]